MNFRYLLILLLYCLLFPITLWSQALLITDCQGFTRAVQSLNPGSLGKVNINVADALGNPADGIEVTLTNSATGEVTTAVSQNGIASFSNVTAGSFSVGSSTAGTAIGSVTVGTMGVGTVAASGVVAATGAVGGGAAVTVGSKVEDAVNNVIGIGNDDRIDPTPTPVRTPLIPTDPDNDISPTPIPTPLPTPIYECDPKVTPKPLSPFF